MKKLLRLNGVKEIYPKCKSEIYEEITDELFPPPVKLGPRMSAWVEDEVRSVIGARIAGKSDDEIRELVKSLVVARKSAA